MQQSLDQLCILFATVGMKPLLELVQHDAHLCSSGTHYPSRIPARTRAAQVLGNRRESPSESLEQSQLRVLGGGLHVHRYDVRGQAWEQAGFDQR